MAVSFTCVLFCFVLMFIYLTVLGLSCGMGTLNCHMWDLDLQAGNQTWAPYIGSTVS